MISDTITLSREAILERKARTARMRRTSVKGRSLHVIKEEEPMAGPSSAPIGSRKHDLKTRRRHCNLSAYETQIARDFVGIGSDSESLLAFGDERLLMVPPSSAGLARKSSHSTLGSPSPNSFRISFGDEVPYTFPRPPIPTPSSLDTRHLQEYCVTPSSEPSSPSSASSPDTPGLSSDEEVDFLPLPSPKFNPRRAAIAPLVIHQHTENLPMLATPLVSEFEKASYEAPTSFDHLFINSSSDESSDSDSDSSDNEWYNNELSKIVSVHAPISRASAASRPESMFLPSSFSLPTPSKRASTSRSRRESVILPHKRTNRQSYIPDYPPPPPPTQGSMYNANLPMSPLDADMHFGAFVSPFASPSPSCNSFRPAPRVPAEFIFEVDHEDEDNVSTFSFAVYGVELDEGDRRFSVQRSPYPESIIDFDDDEGSEVDVDVDHHLSLPLSIPDSPLEGAIAHGLEELRNSRGPSVVVSPAVASSEALSIVLEEDEVDCSSAWSFSAGSPGLSYRSATSADFPMRQSYVSQSGCGSPALKSKWSSSTLGSVYEQHESIATSPRMKLRSYFSHSTYAPSGATPTRSRQSSKTHKKSSSIVAPLSPLVNAFVSRKEKATAYPSLASVAAVTHVTPQKERKAKTTGVKRSPSRASVESQTFSDTGNDSDTSTGSGGLKRKPIPVELFMRR